MRSTGKRVILVQLQHPISKKAKWPPGVPWHICTFQGTHRMKREYNTWCYVYLFMFDTGAGEAGTGEELLRVTKKQNKNKDCERFHYATLPFHSVPLFLFNIERRRRWCIWPGLASPSFLYVKFLVVPYFPSTPSSSTFSKTVTVPDSRHSQAIGRRTSCSNPLRDLLNFKKKFTMYFIKLAQFKMKNELLYWGK